MIPVTERPEPASFDKRVRQPGLRYLESLRRERGTAISSGDLDQKPYWRACLPELHAAYDEVCAYLCFRIHLNTGGVTTDHFVAKSRSPDLAYEWSNYRLACAAVNSRKGVHEDVIDPIGMPSDVFRLELTAGRIFANALLSGRLRKAAEVTIDKLGLDSGLHRKRRLADFDNYTNGHISFAHLRRESPFVWSEIVRQGL